MIDLREIVEIIAATGVVEDMAGFDPVKSWKENGVDSLDVMTLLLAIEEKKQIKISEAEADRVVSAVDLVAVINSR